MVPVDSCNSKLSFHSIEFHLNVNSSLDKTNILQSLFVVAVVVFCPIFVMMDNVPPEINEEYWRQEAEHDMIHNQVIE